MKSFAILLIGFLVVLPGCRRQPVFEDELEYSATHTIDEVRELLGVTFEIVNPPDFANDKIKVAGEDIELNSLSRSGRYVLGKATREIPVVWDTHEETMTELNTGGLDKVKLRFFGIRDNGQIIGSPSNNELFLFETNKPPVKFVTTPTDYNFIQFNSHVILADKWLYFKVEQEIPDQPTNSNASGILSIPEGNFGDEKAYLFNLDENNSHEITDFIQKFEVKDINSRGDLVGMESFNAVAYDKNFKEIAKVDATKMQMTNIYGNPADAMFLYANDDRVFIGCTNPYLAPKNLFMWKKDSGFVLLNNENEYAFTAIAGVSKLGLIAARYQHSVFEKSVHRLVIWRADKPQQEPVHLNDAIVDRPESLDFPLMRPFANDNSILARGFDDQDNHKFYLLRPTKND